MVESKGKDWMGRPLRARPVPVPGVREGIDWLGHRTRRLRSTLPAPGGAADLHGGCDGG